MQHLESRGTQIGFLRSISHSIVWGLVIFTPIFAQADESSASSGPFLREQGISWKVNEHNVARWKTLIGGNEGGQISDEDIQFGLWQLAPRAIYHSHQHEVPEIYYILSGKAAWSVGEQTIEVTQGSTIYTSPGKIHKMVNLTDEPVEAIWVWWAPEGKREVFQGEYRFTEEAPAQPDGAGFRDGSSEKLY